MNTPTFERSPGRYFARYIEGGERLLPGTYINDDQIEMDLGTDASKLAFETLSAFDSGNITPEQVHTFTEIFGFTPEKAHQEARIDDLSG